MKTSPFDLLTSSGMVNMIKSVGDFLVIPFTFGTDGVSYPMLLFEVNVLCRSGIRP